MKFLYERTLIFRSFIPGEVPLCIQGVHWDTPPSRKLQQTTKRYFETMPQVACLLDNSCIFLLHTTWLRLSQSQVTLKDE